MPDFDAGYGSKVTADAKKRGKWDQIQSMVKFSSGAAGVIEASRLCRTNLGLLGDLRNGGHYRQ